MPDLTHWMAPLLLVVVANVAPWAAGRCLPRLWPAPLDGGATLADGSRALGDHKTWRGLFAGAMLCGAAALVLHEPALLGVAFGALALTADALSSFVKRRLRLPAGAEVPGLDQLPEALVPLLVLSRPLGLRIVDCIGIALVFLLLDLLVTRLRHPERRAGSG